jgi:hypothetical protein
MARDAWMRTDSLRLTSGAFAGFRRSALLLTSDKIRLDVAALAWIIDLYRRWTGDRSDSKFPLAIVAALLEPFTFQLLRHTGAVLGCYRFLSGRQHRGKQVRHVVA